MRACTRPMVLFIGTFLLGIFLSRYHPLARLTEYWELGKDTREVLQEKRSPMTGTPLFMSIALEHEPLHRVWHDLESFWLVCIYMTIRHVSLSNSTQSFSIGKDGRRLFGRTLLEHNPASQRFEDGVAVRTSGGNRLLRTE